MKKEILKYLLVFCFVFFSFNATIYPQWTQQTNGLQFWHQGKAIDACDSNTAVMVVDSTLFKTEDAGNSWEKVTYPSVGKGVGTDISIIDKDHFWITTDAGGILATSDSGANWSIEFYDTAKTRFMDYIKMFDLNNGVAIGDAVENHPFLFLTTSNGGKEWISVNYNDDQGGYSANLWRPISFVNPSIGYFILSHIESIPELLKTTNGGENWLNYHNFNGDVVRFYNENLGLVVYMSTLGFIFRRTTDGGNSWETFVLDSKDFPSYPSDFEFIPGHPSELWFVDLVNLYFSSDTGRTWTEQKIYNGNLNGSEIVFTDSTHGWLLCDSGKVFHTSNNGGIITSISPDENNTPSEYLLMQNYPNPFNPTTMIKYQLPFASRVTLTIYNILGRKIETIVNSFQQAGNYSVRFHESEFSSGVYFYRIEADANGKKYISTKKMVLLK